MRRFFLFLLLMLLCAVLFGCAMLLPGESSIPTTEATEPSTEVTEPSTEVTEPSTEPPTEPAPTEPPYNDLSEDPIVTGFIYITTGGIELNEQYQEASIRVEWDGGSIEEQTVRIKHRGNLSLRIAWKKSYNVKFDSKVSFMGMDESKKWCLLANHFDKSMLRPEIGFDYAAALGLEYASQTRICKLYLNGVYRGIYIVVEPIQDGKGQVDLDLSEGDFLIERNANSDRDEVGTIYFKTNSGLRFEFNEPEEMTAAQAEEKIQLLNQMEAAIRTADFATYSKYIDVESFVDFYIFHELIKDVDFGRFSTRYYVQGGLLHAGPPWDMDLAMGNVSASYFEAPYRLYYNRGNYGNGSGSSTSGYWAANMDFYQWLCKDEVFMDLVKERWQQVWPATENLVKENELGISRIDHYMTVYDVLESNYNPLHAGWPVNTPSVNIAHDKPAQDYRGNVEFLRSWLTERMAWLNRQWGPAENDNS